VRAHSEESATKGVFRELVCFSLWLDAKSKEHFNKSRVFKGASKRIEKIHCIFRVYHEKGIKECGLLQLTDQFETSLCTCWNFASFG
jgi:hypothetical protein